MRTAAEGVLLDFDGTLTKPAFDWPAMQAEMALPAEVTSILDFLATAPPQEAGRVATILERHEQEAARKAEPNAGARELIAFLRGRGIPFGVVTNNARRHVLPMLRRIGLTIEVLVTRDIGLWKPDPRHALAGAQAIGVQPGHCVFLGDGRFDMLAARAAGMMAVHLASGARGRPSPGPGLPCDHRVGSLPEAIPLLSRLLG